MKRIHLIHRNSSESVPRVEMLRALDYDVSFGAFNPEALREIKASPPDAVILDLSRVPSGGRDAALAIRTSGKLRSVPLIFVEGDAEKVARIRELIQMQLTQSGARSVQFWPRR